MSIRRTNTVPARLKGLQNPATRLRWEEQDLFPAIQRAYGDEQLAAMEHRAADFGPRCPCSACMRLKRQKPNNLRKSEA